MHRVSAFFAWLLLSLAGLCLFLTLLFYLDYATTPEPQERDRSAIFGGLFLAAIAGIPGGVLMWRVQVARRERAFEDELTGYVTSLDAFTVAELAGKIGRTEMETAGLIARMVGERGVDLAFHRPSGRYMHRERVHKAHAIIDRCPSCGASVQHEIVFFGEAVSCRYCGSALASG
ncbi:MAG: hypothetical protein R3A51_05775 [Nannocystaceae bacterium]|nr:hypothetical protein [Myxococcales bacterium]